MPTTRSKSKSAKKPATRAKAAKAPKPAKATKATKAKPAKVASKSASIKKSAAPAKTKAAPKPHVGDTLNRLADQTELPSLVKWLAGKTDEPRMEKASNMLKEDTFRLFSDVSDTELVGVIESQTYEDVFYSCIIKSDGHFCCADQGLKQCKGMGYGSTAKYYPCKHLMVLMVGLAQAGKVTPASIRSWVTKAVELPNGKRIEYDSEKLSATFIKYKGAQAGELDWRPTETIPEDFYAL